MANKEHLEILGQGVEVWNRWREENPYVVPDLIKANLSGATLSGINLSKADLSWADLSWADMSGANLNESNLTRANLSEANFVGAHFREANLSYAFLVGANLSSANFFQAHLRRSKLSHTNLRETIFRKAILSDADLSGAIIRSADLNGADLNSTNLTDAVLQNADLSLANLTAADLQKANLQNTNLSYSQVLITNFIEANLTGACIADWQSGSSTNLKEVTCEYIFRTISSEGFSGRLPVDPNSTFAPGEFTQRFQILASAQETIDITFTDGIDWQAFFTSFQELRSQYPDSNLSIQGLERKAEGFIVRLEVEAEETGPELERLKGEIESAEKALYDSQLLLMKAQGQIEVYQDMMGVVKTLAAKPMAEVNQNFHAPVGNVAGTNYGSMTAYINQNSSDISRLLSSLQQLSQAFPDAQQQQVQIHLDDLATDLQQPEKCQPARMRTRLNSLFGVLLLLGGGVATATAFANDVLDLAEKLNVPAEAFRPQLEQFKQVHPSFSWPS
jgi:uncharacterized protein YjbI with pentapeptide repeats